MTARRRGARWQTSRDALGHLSAAQHGLGHLTHVWEHCMSGSISTLYLEHILLRSGHRSRRMHHAAVSRPVPQAQELSAF